MLCYGKTLTIDAFSTGRTLDEALSTLTHVKELADSVSDERFQADILDALGEVYYVKGHKVSSEESDYPTGLHYFQQALTLREKLHDEYGLCRSSLNVGRMYQNLGQGNLSKARDYYQQCYDLAQELFMTQSVVFALLGIGYIHLDSGETLQAHEQFEQAYALSQAIGLRGGIEEATEALQEITL